MKKEGKKTLGFVEKMQKLIHAGISTSAVPNRLNNEMDDLPALEERVRNALGIISNPNRPVTNMLFFVMYDIGSNKVRALIAKYLQRKGCFRIQRSIFLADLPSDSYEEIRNDLAEVQAAYENKDSILIVPISTDYLRSMRIIGQKIEMDIILHDKNTLFF
ncbi:CRISPR-associated endonuclease Cas2 [Phocaeicola salanitronis]|uniref:CRISPR-associated endonuclease Cas2 n=1 Tax=Phocaeicola salanitronis TaxID=376805 RepID=UPI0032092195